MIYLFTPQICYVAEASFELMIFCLLPFQCHNYRHVAAGLAFFRD